MAEPASSVPTGAPTPESRSRSPEPGAFADLLYLASLAWGAPRVLLAIPETDGGWSLHVGGEKHSPVLDRGLLDLIAAREGVVEVDDLLVARPDSPLVLFPHAMRWVYGLAVRDGSGRPVAVLAVMDRWIRSVSGRDARIMQLMARQVRSRLESGAAPAPTATTAHNAAPATPPASPAQALRPRVEPAPTVSPVRTARPEMHARLLRSGEVAALFDVTERTVLNWASAGKLPSIRTVGGHLRFRQDDIMELISGTG